METAQLPNLVACESRADLEHLNSHATLAKSFTVESCVHSYQRFRAKLSPLARSQRTTPSSFANDCWDILFVLQRLAKPAVLRETGRHTYDALPNSL